MGDLGFRDVVLTVGHTVLSPSEPVLDRLSCPTVPVALLVDVMRTGEQDRARLLPRSCGN